MSELQLSFRASREAVIEDLCAAGFRLSDDGSLLRGGIEIDGKAIEHEISIPEDFPFAIPKVRTPAGEGGLSWHRESDGSFCLWAEEKAANLPWLTASGILGQVTAWHASDAEGWPDDPADLDLERYWPRYPNLVIYPDLDDFATRACKVVKGPNGTYRLRHGKAPRKKRSRVREWDARVVDIGDLAAPVRNFDELSERMSSDDALSLRRDIESGATRFIIVRYRRQGHDAAVVLVASKRNPHDLSAAESAHDGEATRRLRAGYDAEILSGMSVAIVGVGAIGSRVAEMLISSGLGDLTIVDPDLVRPGNCIRHVATEGDVGKLKVNAVKDHLINTGLVGLEGVTAVPSALRSAVQTEELFNDHDLVIDATADGAASALLMTASRILDGPLVAVCLLQNGTIARVDRSPLLDGEEHAPPVAAGGPKTDLREGGCGDPVSPSPPWACSTAAGRAVGMAADLLSGRRAMPASVIDELAKFPDGDTSEP